MRVLAVINQKGGVAKTTTAHHLGVAFAQMGRKVLLIDLDPQASLTFNCGYRLKDDDAGIAGGSRGSDCGTIRDRCRGYRPGSDGESWTSLRHRYASLPFRTISVRC